MNFRYPLHELKNPGFPTLESAPPFWQIPQAPQELYIQGQIEALSLLDRLPRDGLAIVGTRNPQARSRNLVKKIIDELAGTPLIILSGFARGIDTAAHLAAIAAKLPTIAVLGTHLDVNYPSENSELREKILESGGLLISEFPKNTPVYPSHFTQRNRLIAGWAQATWIVEAGAPSGALNTAKWARDQHRTCYATPCFPGDPALLGNQGLLDRDEAIPLWNTETLGQSWSFLSTPYSTRIKTLKVTASAENSDTTSLILEIHSLSSMHGGTSVQEVLNWALRSGWSAQRFFLALKEALQTRQVEDNQGILIARR